MDFELDHEQRLLQQGVERLLADFYAPGRRTTHAASDPGYSTALWRHYADLGVLALDCTGDGGERGDLVHMMTTMEAAGRMLALEPYLGTVVQCASLLRIAGTGTQRGQWLPAIASGDATVAFAHAEHGARYALQQVATRARREHDDWVIDGEKVLVRNGDSADALIVSARIAGADDDRDGIAPLCRSVRCEGADPEPLSALRRPPGRRLPVRWRTPGGGCATGRRRCGGPAGRARA